ncbi:MAG: PAS domain-containing sensor histidine kinase, partial [Desulfobacteraceae bacterium]|nr:PAS domain-containing sensor histidine kinase [Desulfobacteraceae bacterium]
EPFFTTRSKGTGLGLAYALQVVKAHNGTITARNRTKRGACFSVEIPLRYRFHPEVERNPL